MMYIRLLLVALVLTVISWLILNAIRKPVNIGFVFLFWVATILASMAFLYLISVWFVTP
ncbi:hypothetical protein [Thiomicrorhabdus sp. Milos-T2]|uniref:hypothetical protein n=1 Tax=Thiomicrorhabdus sp. Milos-T2 TaxID=90814 RepID=UPI001319BF7E|nr:hypothetical protein [Thiomicrorhabdus sp. Milos-T2]